MAEHLNQKTEPEMGFFNYLGKPVSPAVRQIGYDECQKMGLNKALSWEVVGAVSEQLERDKPYEAQGVGMKFLDLTGTCRLIATILAAVSQEEKQKEVAS